MMHIIKSSAIILAAVAIIGGGTYAFFSAEDEIAGNTAAAAEIQINFNAAGDNGNGGIAKPLVASNLVPGQFSDWFRARLENNNTGSDVPLKYFMYVDDLQPNDLCPELNLRVDTGIQGGDEHARNVYNGTLLGIAGEANKIELTGNPPFTDGVANNGEMQFIQQRVQLDPGAGNGAQGQDCTWTEVFVAETVAPADPGPALP